MRRIDIIGIMVLVLIAIGAVWILVSINPIMLPFALGLAILLIIFIVASFCTGRYSRNASKPPETLYTDEQVDEPEFKDLGRAA